MSGEPQKIYGKIDEALVAVSELFTAAWRGGHIRPEGALKRRNEIEAALEQNRRVIKSFENLSFRFGAMLEPPCFNCGYDGPGYFQPSTHPCAERHHKLYELGNES